MASQGLRDWAAEQFESAAFGDVRRVARARRMLLRAAERPAGQLSDVFTSSAELQGAYDFIEGGVCTAQLMRAFAEASVRALGQAASTYVVVDGTSLSIVDRAQAKGFGSIGKRAFPTQGLKVIDALAVDTNGAPVGLLDLEWWARTTKKSEARYARRRSGDTETVHWLEVIRRTASLLREHAPHVRPWFVVDREGDNTAILHAVAQPGHAFTIRAAQTSRPVLLSHDRRRPLHSHMKKQRVLGQHLVDVPAGPNRVARRALLDVRAAQVVLDLPDHATAKRTPFSCSVVWVRERRAPRGEKPLDWLLLTSADISTLKDAIVVVDGYCHRWRVEDFHRTWKRGHCNVEDTQLRSMERVTRWATILAAVATRVEHLKHLARTRPDEPATVALSAIEIEALRAAKIRIKSRVEIIPDGIPSIAQAVRWIADIGGYTGKSSGGPPGSITIGRGLERLMIWADAFACAKGLPKI